MNSLDWLIIAAYMLGMIALSVYLGQGQEDEADYYVGGRNLSWWAVGISTMATQSGAISFISIPGFMAMVAGGGMAWLQYELAVPLAMVFIMFGLIPFFRKLKLVSVYEYLEMRFGQGTRTLLSAIFLLSRGLGTGVGMYAAAIVLSVFLGLPLWQMILLIGGVTLIYDTIGGMKAVVYSDVVQMVILLSGIGLCSYYALEEVGGLGAVIAAHDPSRFTALRWEFGLGGQGSFPFWGFLVGGFFLYASYYGCDQSQVQRELSAPTLADTKYSLVFNGLARFPLTLSYLFLGLTVGAYFLKNPDAMPLIQGGHPDYMVPTFVLHVLPHGMKALIFSAILAAAMSSLDSAINSLSAATMRDFVEKYAPPKDDRSRLMASKATTVLWGGLVIASAFAFGGQESVVEQINRIGSAFYGPILAAFVAGVMFSRVNGPGVVIGIVAGVGFNILLWFGVEDLYWMWWNAFGCIVALVVALVASRGWPAPDPQVLKHYTLWGTDHWGAEKSWLPVYALLVLYFVGILMLCYFLPTLLQALAA